MLFCYESPTAGETGFACSTIGQYEREIWQCQVCGHFVDRPEIDLQNLVAVLECTSRRMIPKRFQNLDRTRLVTEIKQLKILLGERD